MDALAQDVRFAIRTLLRAPLVSGLAVACLALGIGANATMFSVFDGILIKPFPFKDPDTLVVVTETHQRNGIDDGGMSFLNFRDVRNEARSVTDLAAHTGRTLTFVYDGEAVRHAGWVVSSNLFDLLGARPALGRSFTADDDRPGAPGTLILSDAVWRARFNADPAAIGRTVIVNDAPHTIVGVMAPRFGFPVATEAWIPLEPIHHADPRSERNLRVYGRLTAGVTQDAARDELAAIGGRLAAQHGENQGWTLDVLGIEKDLLPDQPRIVTIAAMGAVSLVLLIACANVANLLLARAAAASCGSC